MVRRRFHGTYDLSTRSVLMRECQPHASCAGRLHFYALNDADAETLFDLIDERQSARADPASNGGIVNVVLEAWTGGRLAISVEDENGGGHGYRIAGPKFAAADTQRVARKVLDERDASEIRRMLDSVYQQASTGSSTDTTEGNDG